MHRECIEIIIEILINFPDNAEIQFWGLKCLRLYAVDEELSPKILDNKKINDYLIKTINDYYQNEAILPCCFNLLGRSIERKGNIDINISQKFVLTTLKSISAKINNSEVVTWGLFYLFILVTNYDKWCIFLLDNDLNDLVSRVCDIHEFEYK